MTAVSLPFNVRKENCMPELNSQYKMDPFEKTAALPSATQMKFWLFSGIAMALFAMLVGLIFTG
ncbi:MAG: hypothetical protein COW18_06940 [Zetaproteobacteria bacterium CG12_big_fil_rev_8_21_14_0_65_54_13]|nr:MAG: hypothetical protein COW18_06940 [Zetaproteobacteria bacterium CG12_big_fil_rev_8_21_14_0_65_54_13]PIX54314.1 MAG: hypothetical protein COZ50_08370 [Zetaproteobacteria bacterium CG_4_10_14_3_um_filter_54_28]PJA28518.1 MAG: hypothetical protein CO188_09025 [Zetaproteobacteria bacterium CG_4_9_14_3_um_filter_54_145]